MCINISCADLECENCIYNEHIGYVNQMIVCGAYGNTFTEIEKDSDIDHIKILYNQIKKLGPVGDCPQNHHPNKYN